MHISTDHRALGLARQVEQRAHWATLQLRQNFMDEAFMRAHLRAAGIVVKYNNEPATPGRLATLLRRAGVSGAEAREAVGATMARFLALNPALPLWAAVALVLEATGGFTPAPGMHLN